MTTAIAEYSKTDAALADLRTKYEAVVFDVTNSKGMDQAKKARAEIREHRVSLEKERVRIKAPALERCRQIDSEAKRITAELESLERPIDGQIKQEEEKKEREKAAKEQAERDRVTALNARFDAIRAMPGACQWFPSAAIAEKIAEVEAIDIATFPADSQDAARFEIRLAVNGMRAALDKQLVAEAERAELEKLRAEQEAVRAERERLEAMERERIAAEQRAQAEKERAEREERIRAEAAQKAQQEAAEAVAMAERQAEEAAERERAASERAAADQAAAVKEAEERAERKRMAFEAQVKAEQEKREANRKHVAGINNAAAAALVAGGLSESDAKTAITLIASGKVPAVSVAY